MQKQHLYLSIPGTKKPNQIFPIDPHGDLKIIYNKNQYILHRAHLNLYSSYFKEVICTSDQITIPTYFQDNIFDEVLSILYGNCLYVDRNSIWKYYDVAIFLGIQNLLNSIRIDIAKNIEQYDIFILLKISQKQSDQKLFELCFQQLQKYQFNQLLYNQSQLMNLDIGLFKLVIKTHNKSKNTIQKPSQYKKIILLIESYCSVNSISEDVLEEMIFSMVDITSLSAIQFKSIFLNHSQSKILFSQNKSSQNSIHKNSSDKSHDSSLYDISQLSQQYYLQKLTKKISQFINQNYKISIFIKNAYNYKHQLSRLLAQSVYQQKTQQEIQINFKQIRSQQKMNNKKILNKYSYLIDQLQQQMIKKDQRIQFLEQFCASFSMNNKNNQQFSSKNCIVQSQFLTASFIHQIMSQPKKIIKQYMTEPKITRINKNKEQIQQNYLNFLEFNTSPITITKKNYSTLGKLIGLNEFNNKKLCIIYRRSHNKNIAQIGKKQVIEKRKNLLFLIKTKTKQKIGFHISSKLQKNIKIQDKQTFMFSITHNNKFRLQPNHIPDIIEIREKELISISNILIIPQFCIENKSLFLRSCLKNQGVKGKGKGLTWLEEETQFFIEHIQIFQILQQQNSKQL